MSTHNEPSVLKKSVSMVSSLSVSKNPIGKAKGVEKKGMEKKGMAPVQERLKTNESNRTRESKGSASNKAVYRRTVEQVQKKLELLQKKNK